MGAGSRAARGPRNHGMKMPSKIVSLALLVTLTGACQAPPPKHERRFQYATDPVMNPVTRNYEQAPPYGPRSNKAE